MKNYKTAFCFQFGILGLSRLYVFAGPHVVEMISPYNSAANGSKL
jgi:hypothetical protein